VVERSEPEVSEWVLICPIVFKTDAVVGWSPTNLAAGTIVVFEGVTPDVCRVPRPVSGIDWLLRLSAPLVLAISEQVESEDCVSEEKEGKEKADAEEAWNGFDEGNGLLLRFFVSVEEPQRPKKAQYLNQVTNRAFKLLKRDEELHETIVRTNLPNQDQKKIQDMKTLSQVGSWMLVETLSYYFQQKVSKEQKREHEAESGQLTVPGRVEVRLSSVDKPYDHRV